jgi:hypothetical protein
MSEEFATIYALLYGDEYKLHERFLTSLFRYTPMEQVLVRLWCNTVGERTKDLIQSFGRSYMVGHLEYMLCGTNVPKYKAMRTMFHTMWEPKTPWIIWFDDDSYIDRSDWFKKTKAKIEESGPSCCYVGQPWYVHHLPGQWKFISQSGWFTGRPSEQCLTKKRGVTAPGVNFAQGAYWWLKTDVMRKIDWPDPRLSHNGGDTLLGEAIWQQHLPFTRYHYGVAVNKAKRRGIDERPAGSSVDTRR